MGYWGVWYRCRLRCVDAYGSYPCKIAMSSGYAAREGINPLVMLTEHAMKEHRVSFSALNEAKEHHGFWRGEPRITYKLPDGRMWFSYLTDESA